MLREKYILILLESLPLSARGTKHTQCLLWRFHLHICLRPNVGVPEDRGDLAVEAAAERLPGGRQPQAKWNRQPQGFAEGKHGKDGDSREAE